MSRRVLVVDDDIAIRSMVSIALQKVGFAVNVAASAEEAWATYERTKPELVVSDIYMAGATGISLLERIASDDARVPVILMTARGSVETAAIAKRVGAVAYIAKPFDLHDLIARVRSALLPASPAGDAPSGIPDSIMTGAHPSMIEVYNAIATVAPLDVPVLILGETGTGKELVARAIHALGARAEGPIVAINCGAIPDTLLESELFGHVRGAFTDARRDRRGALASADGGTVFLDEIGEISLASQVKLLRFLDDRIVRPVGSDRGERVDVRVVAATNRPLARLASEDRFRRDLYFRLASWEIHVPPLRERRSDIELLVETFRLRACREMGITCGAASRPLLDVLEGYDWPGNVRELEHVVRRLLIESRNLSDARAAAAVIATAARGRTMAPAPVQPLPRFDKDSAPLASLDAVERAHIQAVLDAVGGNRTRAAEILGIDRRTLARKLNLSTDDGAPGDIPASSEEDR